MKVLTELKFFFLQGDFDLYGIFCPQLCVLKAVLGYFQLLYQSNTTETLLDMHSLMMSSDLVEWKCVLEAGMVLCVTTIGTTRVPL